MIKLPKAMQRQADMETFKALGIDVSALSDADIREGAEAVRRITQCEKVAGSNKRRPAAKEAWQAFLAKHNLRAEAAGAPPLRAAATSPPQDGTITTFR
jgi:hypothetical protein